MALSLSENCKLGSLNLLSNIKGEFNDSPFLI
jgi:hypothetical protein